MSEGPPYPDEFRVPDLPFREHEELAKIELSIEDEREAKALMYCPEEGCGALLGEFGDDAIGSEISCPNCEEVVPIG